MGFDIACLTFPLVTPEQRLAFAVGKVRTKMSGPVHLVVDSTA